MGNTKLSYYSKRIFALFLIYLAMFIIIIFSSDISMGVKNGISISLNLIVPSLFIFMILSNIIIHSYLSDLISIPFRFIGKYLFRISNKNITIVILSLIGGYPIGAKLISDEVKSKNMSVETGQRMINYCVNCGPAFLVTAVGIGVFGSARIGFFLYISQVIACVLIGFITSFSAKNEIASANFNAKKNNPKKISSVLIVSAVNDAVKALVVICSFIVAFSALIPIVGVLTTNLDKSFQLLIGGVLEVTNGCSNLNNIGLGNTIILANIFTSFGGVCVYLQILAMLKGSKIKLGKFFLYRIIYIVISSSVMVIFLKLSPQAVSCISMASGYKTFVNSVSPAATIFLIFMCIMMLFFSSKSDRIR